MLRGYSPVGIVFESIRSTNNPFFRCELQTHPPKRQEILRNNIMQHPSHLPRRVPSRMKWLFPWGSNLGANRWPEFRRSTTFSGDRRSG